MEQIGSDTREPPLLIQFRMFYNGYAVKGTLLVNKKLAPSTIQIRESMIKVKPDPVSKHPTVNSLEIVRTSNPPKETFLSRYLIALLSHGGVPDKFFTDLLSKALREDRGNFSNKHAAFKVAKKYGNMDSDFTVARMIACGIPLDESFLQYRLSVLTKDETKSLKKGKLLIPDCFFLMGTTDPTGKLKSDEVCVVLDNDQVLGKVLVYRYPGQHFGDIHVLKATNIEELESFVGNEKNAIFFSQKGARSVADEIAGGDLDGDLYWVSRNGELLKHFTPSEPWVPKPSMGKVDESKMPRNLSDEQLEDELIELFLKTRFQPSYAKSDAADSWLAHMDRSLTLGDDKVAERNAIKKKLIKLNDINHEALDAPKKGVTIKVPRELRPKEFPHYMERKNSFKSNSILGKIYDQVKAYMEEDLSKKEIRKLPCFDVDVPENCWKSWKGNYDMYRAEMFNALSNNDSNVKNKAADKIITKYKKLLYGAKELEETTRKMDDIYNEALAIYNLSYNYAISKNDVAKCSFAWKVAGSALFKLYAKKKGERTFIFSPSVLNEMF
ncbi:hypothetical protein TIFTF001_019771 [Ficus carica]|uniref:RNA-dependent RNA polymerase n=1 Tax=Ficus carica TaxID=3494 RepID=A0AA88A9H3_FICCA|nr:hypothetical protein TIFTF001_019771 [Ficus carica]